MGLVGIAIRSAEVGAARVAETALPRLSSTTNEALDSLRGVSRETEGSDAKAATELAEKSANSRSSSEGFRAAFYLARPREEDSVSASRLENVRDARPLGSNNPFRPENLASMSRLENARAVRLGSNNPFRPENLASMQNSSRARLSDSLVGGRESASRGEEGIFSGFQRAEFASAFRSSETAPRASAEIAPRATSRIEDGTTSIANTEGRGQSAEFAERAKVLEQKLKERNTLIKSATSEKDNPVGDKVAKSFAEKTWKEKTAKERLQTIAPHLFTGSMFIGPEVGGEVQNAQQNAKIERERTEDKTQAAIDAKVSSMMSGLQEAFAVARG